MKFNFKNRVRNFKFSVNDVFIPLYEAIVNSMQAIEETKNFKNSFINIKIERDSYRIADYISGIFSIEITDNGIGFVEHNYESFCTSDSDYKVEIGGKGVGRINWLKAFEITYIKSVFEENGKRYERVFSFNIENEIHDETIREVELDTPLETKILLYNLNQEYRSATELKLKEIAGKIIEHFASYFVIGAMPQITISDETDSYNLNEYFEKEKFIKTKDDTVISNNTSFNLRHVFLRAANNTKHKIYICAQNRVVCSYDLTNIKDLPSNFSIDSKKAIYQCYVSGEFLDNDVNSERTYFSNVIFEEEDKNAEPHFELAINLYEIVYNQIDKFLSNYLEPMREIRDDSVITYIENYCPQYRYLIKYASEELQNISYTIATNKDKLDAELNRLSHKFNLKNNQKVNKTLQDESFNAKNRILQLVAPLTENLRSEYASYLIKRNATIEIYERLIALDPTFEELVNQFLIINNSYTSDFTNLWIVDESLTFNYVPLKYISNNFFGYTNEVDKEMITIYFEDPKKIMFDVFDNPVIHLNECLNKLENIEEYKIKKYLIVSDSFGIVSEGLADKDTKVLSYSELAIRAKNRIKTF